MLCIMALISGLFLGLFTLDALDLEIIQRSKLLTATDMVGSQDRNYGAGK